MNRNIKILLFLLFSEYEAQKSYFYYYQELFFVILKESNDVNYLFEIVKIELTSKRNPIKSKIDCCISDLCLL